MKEVMTLDKGREGHRREGSVVGKRSIGPCPPHGPMIVARAERGVCVARCLKCGLSGPARGDGVDAKRALEDASREYQPGRRRV